MQVLCLPSVILNLLTNAFVHLYLAFYVICISLKTICLRITFIPKYILETRCTHTGEPYCTHNIVLYFLPYFNIILTTYSIYFMTYLFIFIIHVFIILLVPHNCFRFFKVFYLFILKLYCILCIHMNYLSEINIQYITLYKNNYVCKINSIKCGVHSLIKVLTFDKL